MRTFLNRLWKSVLWAIIVGLVIGFVAALLGVLGQNYTHEDVNIRVSVAQNQRIMVNPAADIIFGSCGNKFGLALSSGGQMIPEYLPEDTIPVAVEGPCWQKTLKNFEGQILVTKGPVTMVIRNASAPVWVHVYFTSTSFWIVVLNWFKWTALVCSILFLLLSYVPW